MASKTLFYKYLDFTIIALYILAALPEKVYLKNKTMTYIFNNVWPKIWLLIWCPLVPMVTLKILQFISSEQWEEFLAIMHMYFLGCNCLYLAFAMHKTSTSFKKSMDGIKQHFKVWHRLNSSDMLQVIILVIILIIGFLFYVGGNIYYGEVLVPLWVPFINNDEDYPLLVFLGIWLYEGLTGVVIFLIYGIITPFPVVMTSAVVNELDYLIQKVENVKFNIINKENKVRPLNNYLISNENIYFPVVQADENRKSQKNDDCREMQNVLCTSEKDTKTFIAETVEHHLAIWRVTKEISTIYSSLLLTQILFTVCHSCFLAFNIYYTERLNKVIFMSSPILVFSYYILFMQCWNGDRLTEAYDRLFRALYRCPWYDAPHSFKTSLNIMMMFSRRPVELAGGGIFKASLQSFSHGVQQSISYILLLKQLTPEK